MYAPSSNWLNSGPPRRSCRGLGDTDTTASVVGCAPDLCFTSAFPWLGRRAESGAVYSFAGPLDASVPQVACVCQPVFEVPALWGTVISVALAALVGFKLVSGVMR